MDEVGEMEKSSAGNLDLAFWFAVLSPALGVVVGLIAAFLIYH
jgi:hypothetical protein